MVKHSLKGCVPDLEFLNKWREHIAPGMHMAGNVGTNFYSFIRCSFFCTNNEEIMNATPRPFRKSEIESGTLINGEANRLKLIQRLPISNNHNVCFFIGKFYELNIMPKFNRIYTIPQPFVISNNVR
jgi:hypothetical protein